MKVNGERNGKGKEYYQDNWKFILKYEGEYLDGKRNGNGKEYRNDDLIKFEGKCLYTIIHTVMFVSSLVHLVVPLK